MPVIDRWKGYVFRFYSKEEERAHVHVFKQGAQAKVWLEPDVEIGLYRGYSAKELNVIEKRVRDERKAYLGEWRHYFGD